MAWDARNLISTQVGAKTHPDDAEPTEQVQPPVASATARRIAAATMAAPASSSSDAAATAAVTSA